jgi:simple sugar transport system permease protein
MSEGPGPAGLAPGTGPTTGAGVTPAPAHPAAVPVRRLDLRAFIYRYGLLVVLVVLIAYFAATLPAFATTRNALIVLQSVAIVTVVALGVTVSLAAGGFDLSVGSNVGFAVMSTTTVMVVYAMPAPVAIAAGILGGIAIGLFNGALIVKARIPDLLATLGTMFVVMGLTLMMTSGESVSPGMTVDAQGNVAPGKVWPDFLWLGREKILGEIPVPVIVMAIVVVLVIVFLDRTRWGRMLYAIGGNQDAARLAGIRVERMRVMAYVISGILASVGGILLAARLGRGDVGAGDAFLLESVAAALIGYAVLGANRPNAIGTFVGAVFVGVLINGLTMMNFPYYTQDFIKGALLVAALVMSFSSLFRRGQRR